MISLSTLAALADRYAEDLDRPVKPLTVGTTVLDTDARPALMGCLNLSRESTYRDSVVLTTEAAVRRGRVLVARGADLVDVGAESSSPGTPRVGPDEQAAVLAPVIEALTAADVPVSVETYHPAVARAGLSAGARMINYSGGEARDPEMFEVAAEFGAAVVLCFVPGDDVRQILAVDDGTDPVAVVLDQLGPRVERAGRQGVENLVVDPGVGFSFTPTTTADERTARQTRMLLQGFRLRALGLPVCQSLPNAFHLFEDQFRTAEGFFAVLAHLGGCGVYRTHEVARLAPVLATLRQMPTL